VRELLWEGRTLRRHEQLPTAAEARLTQRLNAVHYFFAVDGALGPTNATKRKAIDYIGAARRALAKLADHEREFLAAAEAVAAANPKDAVAKMSAEAKRDHLEQIASADGLLGHVAAMPVLERRYSTGQAQKWTSQADLLFDALKEALASLPGRPLGLSDRVGRFFEVVVPLLTGERVTVGAAVKKLKRLRRDARRLDAADNAGGASSLVLFHCCSMCVNYRSLRRVPPQPRSSGGCDRRCPALPSTKLWHCCGLLSGPGAGLAINSPRDHSPAAQRCRSTAARIDRGSE
jgi:hypothetical protein